MKTRLFDTKWAKFELCEDSIGRITESHIGYGKGCFWTKPQFVGFSDEIGSIDDVKEAFISVYGEKQ